MQTAIYCRLSTEEQVTEGFSIHAQKDKLIKYAESNDWDIVDYYVNNGISDKNLTDRKEVSRLIEDLKKGKINNNKKIDTLNAVGRMFINIIETFNKVSIDDYFIKSNVYRIVLHEKNRLLMY